jgi:hypothetical protein
MIPRARIWCLGALAMAGPVILLARDPDLYPFLVPLVLLAAGLAALVSEVRTSLARARTLSNPPKLRDDRPADGVVDLAEVLAVKTVANRVDPRFRRFVAWDELGEPAVPAQKSPPACLRGRVVLVALFLGRDFRGWTDREVADGHRSLERAGRWLEREAARYAVPLNLELAVTYFQVQDDSEDAVEVEFGPEGDDFGPMEARASTKQVAGFSRAAAELGAVDAADLVERVAARVEADAVAWLVLIRRAGRSLAVPSGESGLPGVGFASCYAREESFPEPLEGAGRVDPTTVAHELLHLFGAADKYGVPLDAFPSGSLTDRDVMRLEHATLSRLRIDPATALELGWPGKPMGNGSKRTPAETLGRGLDGSEQATSDI